MYFSTPTFPCFPCQINIIHNIRRGLMIVTPYLCSVFYILQRVLNEFLIRLGGRWSPEDVSTKQRQFHFKRRPKAWRGQLSCQSIKGQLCFAEGERFFRQAIYAQNTSFSPTSVFQLPVFLPKGSHHNKFLVYPSKDIKCTHQHTVYTCGFILHALFCTPLLSLMIYFRDYFILNYHV